MHFGVLGLGEAGPLFASDLVAAVVHAPRRIDEMEATADMLAALGVEPVMTRSTVESLRNVLTGGVPSVPDQAKS
jgi:hypothetical protein